MSRTWHLTVTCLVIFDSFNTQQLIWRVVSLYSSTLKPEAVFFIHLSKQFYNCQGWRPKGVFPQFARSINVTQQLAIVASKDKDFFFPFILTLHMLHMDVITMLPNHLLLASSGTAHPQWNSTLCLSCILWPHRLYMFTVHAKCSLSS